MEYVQVRAHLDPRTTAICRSLHGRIIPVGRLVEQRDDYLGAVRRHDRGAAIRSWAMHPGGASIQGRTDALPAGTAMPPYHFRCRTITVAYWMREESTVDRWTRQTYDREPLSEKDAEKLIERVKDAAWPHVKVSRGHYRKHGPKVKTDTQAAYNQQAVDLIRRPDRDLYLSIRKNTLNVVFARPVVGGQLVTVVDVPNRKILSYQRKNKLTTAEDEVQIVPQRGRGIQKTRDKR